MKRERNTVLVYLTYLSVLFCRDTKYFGDEIFVFHIDCCGQSEIREIWGSYKSPFSPFQEFKTFLKYNFSRAHELLRTNSRRKKSGEAEFGALYHSRERERGEERAPLPEYSGKISDFSRMHRSHKASTMRTHLTRTHFVLRFFFFFFFEAYSCVYA